MLAAILAIEEVLVLLRQSPELLSAAVAEDTGAGIVLGEYAFASHASCLLAGRALSDSLKGVGRIRGDRLSDEAAARAIHAEVRVDRLRRFHLTVAMEKVALDLGLVCGDVYGEAVHSHRESVLLLDDATNNSAQAVAACPDTVD